MGFNGTHNELEQFDDRKSDAVFKKGDSGEFKKISVNSEYRYNW